MPPTDSSKTVQASKTAGKDPTRTSASSVEPQPGPTKPQTRFAAAPAAALRLAAEMKMAAGAQDAGGGMSQPATFEFIARTGQPIRHPWWEFFFGGPVVHDLAGMFLPKPAVIVDYCHDPKEILGSAATFKTDAGALSGSGTLIPTAEGDRASEILAKGKAGVPYEMSINFSGEGIEIEAVPPGMSVQVNGQAFAGPGAVVRKWPLRSLAICPHGADQGTSAQFASQETTNVTVLSSDSAAGPGQEKNPSPGAGAAPTELTPAAQAAGSEIPNGEPQAPAPSDPPGKKFLDAFGEKGGLWFAQGKTFEEARGLHLAGLQADLAAKDVEIAGLKGQISAMEARLGAVDRGDKTPASFQADPGGEAKRPTKADRLRQNLGANLAAFASGLRFVTERQ